MGIKRQLLLSTAIGLVAYPHAGGACPAAPFAEQFSWSGPYAGIQLGWAGGASTAVDCAFTGGSPCTPNGAPNLRTGGLLGGIEAGYNWQRGHWLLGVEADIDRLGLNDSGHFSTTDTAYANGAQITSGYDWLGTARGRAGFATDHALVFATGGFAFANVNQQYSDLDGNTAAFSGIRGGWTIGGGVEYTFDQQVSFKVEYLYVNLPSSNLSITYPAVPVASTTSLKFGNDLNVVRAGVNFHF
jgi:outer membrane immunogenic protein